MNTGILEKYVLGIASPREMAEIDNLRKLSPEIAAEITAIEKRLEKVLTQKEETPPYGLFEQISQRINWQDIPPPPPPSNGSNSYILQETKTMTISIWWRCAFIAALVLIMTLAITSWYFYNRSQALEQMLWHR